MQLEPATPYATQLNLNVRPWQQHLGRPTTLRPLLQDITASSRVSECHAASAQPELAMTTMSATPEPSKARTGALRHKSTASNASRAAMPTNRRLNRASTVDPLSDRATQALIRKVLLPQESGDKGRDSQTPIEELLPPLTSRNDVDLQLYAFLAIILREFVQSWYNKITPDESLVAEILHVIAHCTRALEQRLRKLDLESLLLHEIPEMLDKHITSKKRAKGMRLLSAVQLLTVAASVSLYTFGISPISINLC